MALEKAQYSVEIGAKTVVNMEPLTVSIKEAAQLLGVSRPTMYRIIHRADFSSFKEGNRRLIPLAELRRWVEEQAQRGDS